MASLLTWDQNGERYFEGGVDRGVLYAFENKTYGEGVAWNGLTAVNESHDGGDENELYADNIKYAGIRGTERFKPTIEAYTYPDEFAECDGSAAVADGVYLGQQKRKPFGLSYRSRIGNDEDGFDCGYKIHLVYFCTASPSDRNRETINDSPDAMTFSWELSTTPEEVGTGYKPTAHIEIDSRTVDETKLATFEQFIYGIAANASDNVSEVAAKFPTAASVVDFFTKENPTIADLKAHTA